MGGKSDGLRRLAESGARVPPYVLVGPGDRAAPAALGPGPYAVRSDADDEDGPLTSGAGRYATFLHVEAADVEARVDEVRASYEGRAYGVIVQRMVPAAVSGVAFSAHPGGILDQVVVAAGVGAGAVVGGDVAARTWVTSTADSQRYTYATGPGVPDLLTPGELDELVVAALRTARWWGLPVDIEWALEGGTLWLLQARPITALPAAEATTLDNSNLVESYPGLVSPLTASFVPRAYEGVFGSLALRVTGDPRLVAAYRDVLAQMVVASSGRLYYRMESWYAALGLMPFSRRYVEVWQTSLGVADRGYTVPASRAGRRQRLVTAVRLLRELRRTPRELRRLHDDVAEVASWFPGRLAAAATTGELQDLYLEVEARLLARWDVTLLNDVRAFVLPAILGRVVGDQARVNELMSGIASIESLRPVRELASLAADAPPELGQVTTAAAAAAYLAGPGPYPARLRAFVDAYGDRYLEELKLESPTFRTDPQILIEAIKAFGGAAAAARPARPESAPGTDRVGGNPVVRRLSAAAGRAIAARESSRLDRARVYGMVRGIVRRAGELLAAEGHLERPEDVVWLTLDEVWGPHGAAEPTNTLVADRRRDQRSYARLPAFRRVTFSAAPFDVHVPDATSAPAGTPDRAVLGGVGVSGGTASGEVLVVADPRTVGDVTGRVLVTPTTDPGWVFLVSRAAAVVAEQGSLLSHTAIVARELGVPAVVGIPGATRALSDGERVTVDGTRGEVRR